MDGTLFACDSQLRFARWVLRRHSWRRLYLLAVLPCGILRLLGLLHTEQMKRIFLSYTWGMTEEDLITECQNFVDQELIPAIYPAVLSRLKTHQAKGDTTILCSASPNWWTQIVGERLGFTHTIGTPVLLQGTATIMPHIPAPGNNKGSNKLTRLADIGITKADIGYTDSAADLPMLSICTQAVLINPKPSLTAKLHGAEVINTAPPLPAPTPVCCVLGI